MSDQHSPHVLGCGGNEIIATPSLDKLAAKGVVFSESAVLRKTEVGGGMYRTGQWKYAYYLDGNEELYNLEDDPCEWNNLAGDQAHTDVVESLRQKTVAFWEPSNYLERLRGTPIMSREKHFYEFSNQFVTGSGSILDGQP